MTYPQGIRYSLRGGGVRWDYMIHVNVCTTGSVHLFFFFKREKIGLVFRVFFISVFGPINYGLRALILPFIDIN